MTSGRFDRLTSTLAVLACAWTGCLADTGVSSESADRPASLYLYPPASSQLPAQVVPYANIESNTSGTVKLDPGVNVVGQLILPVENETGDVTDTQVSGKVAASLLDTWLDYEGQTNFSDTSVLGTLTFALIVPTGTYDLDVEASLDGYTIPRQTVKDVYLSPRDEGTVLELRLDPGVPLEVQLTDAEGNPLTGVAVYTLDPENGAYTSSPSTSTEAGVYLIQVVHGEQQLWMGPDEEHTTPVFNELITELMVGDEPILPVEHTYLWSSYKLSGQTIDGLGGAVPDVTVFATRQAEDGDGNYKAQTTTGSDGRFSLQLPEGVYDLVFRPSSASAGLSGARMTQVNLHDDDFPLGAVQLPAQVSFRVTTVGPDGAAVAGASLTMYSDDRANPSTSAFSGPDGMCELQVGLGSYLLEIDPPLTSGLARKVIAKTISSDPTDMGELELDEGFTSSLTFLADGEGLPDLVVQAWEVVDDGRPQDSPAHLLGTAVSDANGTAEMILPLQ